MRRRLLSLLVVVTSLVFLIVDVATPNLFDGAVPALICINIVTAQLTVICIWGTLVRGTFWIRLPWTFLLLVVSWYALAWGISIERDGIRETNAILGCGLVWLIGFVASFVPLKVAALFFRWQILQPEDAETKQRKGYAVKDIMIGTMLLAVVMAVGKLMLPNDAVSLKDIFHSSGLNEPELVIAISIFAVVSLLIKLPCIWVAMAAQRRLIGNYILVLMAYSAALAIVEIVLLGAIIGEMPGELIAGMLIGHMLMVAVMLAICLSLRGLGYRMERSIGNDDAEIEQPLLAEPVTPVHTDASSDFQPTNADPNAGDFW